MSVRPKTVFFLGAGATIDVIPEAPSNNNLVEKSLNHADREESAPIYDFIGDVFKDQNKPVINNQIWNLLDYMLQEGRAPSKKYSLEHIAELKITLLRLMIKEFRRSLSSSHIGVDSYSKFAKNIGGLNCSVVSTNYDIFIDNSLRNNRIDFNYGTKIRKPLSGSVDFHDMKRPVESGSGQERINSAGISLLKIHGSLNWLYCKKCDEVDWTAEKIDPDDLKKLYCYNQCCTNLYTPLLIAPTMFKDYGNRIIKEIWSCAEEALINAENLVFIGYSLKDEDYQIHCLLMKALLNKANNYNKVIVIEKKQDNQNEKVRLAYNALYGNIVDFQPIGFLEFVEKINDFCLCGD